MYFNFNKDTKRRAYLLGIPTEAGDHVSFDNLSAAALKSLIEEKFANPEETQNCSPTIAGFLTFMMKHPNFTAHGYVIGLGRSDYRVSIEGLECSSDFTQEDKDDFIEFQRTADELEFKDHLRSWWD